MDDDNIMVSKCYILFIRKKILYNMSANKLK